MKRLELRRTLLSLIAFFLILLAAPGCHRKAAPTYPLFDMPVLLGKNIHEIEAVLGHGSSAPEDASSTGNIAHKVWVKSGQSLGVTYSKSSGLVADLTLTVDKDTGSLKDDAKNEFLRTGNLKDGDTNYNLAFIETPEKVFEFTGVKMTPQSTAHTVMLRVDGSSALMTVTYSPNQAGSSGIAGQTLTIPPWETSFTANLGDTIELNAILYGEGGNPPSTPAKIELQILVDGKVLSKKSLTGWSAKCSLQL